MRKILFLFFCLLLGFASCSSDDDNNNVIHTSAIIGLWGNNNFRDEFTSNLEHIEWDYDYDLNEWNKYEAGKYKIKGDSLLYINNNNNKIYDRYKIKINNNILTLENKRENINITYTKIEER